MASITYRYHELDVPVVTVAVDTPAGTMTCVGEWDLAHGTGVERLDHLNATGRIAWLSRYVSPVSPVPPPPL